VPRGAWPLHQSEKEPPHFLFQSDPPRAHPRLPYLGHSRPRVADAVRMRRMTLVWPAIELNLSERR
jgi:hypothetical protein